MKSLSFYKLSASHGQAVACPPGLSRLIRIIKHQELLPVAWVECDYLQSSAASVPICIGLGNKVPRAGAAFPHDVWEIEIGLARFTSAASGSGLEHS